MKRSAKVFLAVVAALSLTTVATPADAAVAAGAAAVAGNGTQDPLPLGLTSETIERHIEFTATGAFTIPPAAAVEVLMECFLDSVSSETLLSGQGTGLLYCEAANGDGIYVPRFVGSFTRVGPQVVYTSSSAQLALGDTGASVELVLTFSIVPTDLSTTEFAMAGALAVASVD